MRKADLAGMSPYLAGSPRRPVVGAQWLLDDADDQGGFDVLGVDEGADVVRV